MTSFFQLWDIIEAERSGLSSQDFTHLSLADRMAQGRDVGEEFIRKVLAHHGVFIKSATSSQDKRQKIDGFWNGEAVQIKLRRSSRGGSNDIAFEVVRNHEKDIPLSKQLEDPNQQGRDWIGSAKHYFVMNQQETEIYHVHAEDLKKIIGEAIKALNNSQMLGHLTGPFNFRGVDLRPTKDRDPESFTPFKVMAFVPVELVKRESYEIVDIPEEPKEPPRPKDIGSTYWQHILSAQEGEEVEFQKPNNAKKLKFFLNYVKKRKDLDADVEGNVVKLRKAS